MVLLHLVFVLLLGFSRAEQRPPTLDVGNCTCGFYDEEADLLFTDTSIIYFNETNGIIPDDLVLESFAHKYDLGWNALYRQGAAVENVKIGNDVTARNTTSLILTCNPSDPDHLVVGASVRTARQDIFFGSFRASMRGPRHWELGSSLSMVLNHNLTERWDIDVMNTDNSSWAWVSMLMKGQFSNTWLGTNFSTLIADGMDPWYYVEYRVDWTRDRIDYYIGGQLQKSYTRAINGTLPSTPAPLRWQHWSLGNRYNTQGPPLAPSDANIQWTRIFFNSSLTTDEQRQEFDARCSPAAACRMDDYSLRGSTAYPPEALEPWKQYQPPYKVRWVPLIIDIVFASLFTVLLVKTLWRRASWGPLYEFLGISKKKTASPCSSTDSGSSTTAIDPARQVESVAGSGAATPASFSPPPAYSGPHTPAPQYQTPAMSPLPSRAHSADDLTIRPPDQTPGSQAPSRPSGRSTPGLIREEVSAPVSSAVQGATPVKDESENMHADQEKKEERKAKDKKPEATKPASTKPPRVDYLAGFIAMSALLVTLNHFGLTFWAAVIIPSVMPHYQSEIWARKTFAVYFLDPLWIGPFLMISTRFLVSNYLRTGKLDNMAQKIVARPFRLLTPVASIAALEYFLMDAGAVNWLQYLPSVTWSSWPFTTVVQNPGVFVSEIVELAYLIPNAAPMITYNYCTGVLWTIPVQLQGAWQTLLALVMIKQCKTPWKRFAFYAFCIVNHWYALSWGSYYYAGVLLADLEITYKYKKWLWARPWVYYPLLWFLIAVALGGFTIDMVTQWTGVEYAEYEYGWHPDIATGLSISQAGNNVYPDYFVPRLNALLTTVSMQAIVEISPAVQKALSIKILQWIFPHIFTIYLIHGFIFWSVGSWAMISFFSYGLPYWLCVLLVAIVCYGTLFASLPILTPPIELLGKNFAQRLWELASQEPPPRRPTTYPFGKQLVMRDVNNNNTNGILDDKGKTVARESDEKPDRSTITDAV
ncbi:hypothetical protein VTN77DRAFT_6505 [Rasamsonia byssochlamydoides]|uniref:uncharacterized protein n=1 Tax=Rasamsonia byssochlamydoides TaxID=89139 RepID=UPI0037440B09